MGVIYVRSFYVKLIDYGSFFPLSLYLLFFFFFALCCLFVCLFVCMYSVLFLCTVLFLQEGYVCEDSNEEMKQFLAVYVRGL